MQNPSTSKYLVQIAIASMNATDAFNNKSFSYEYNNTMPPSLLTTATTTIAAAAARTMTTNTHYTSSFLPTFSATTTTTPSSSSSLWSTTIAGGQNDTLMAARSADSPDVIKYELVQIFFCILYSTVFVLGVFGNVLVCYVVLRNRAMQTVTNIFITNLALSDILLCVLAVPFTPLYTFMGRWAFGKTLCHLVSFAQGCSIYISTLTLTSIAIDRYFVIIYPFHPRMKLSTCIAIIVSIWVISLLATLPYGMYMKVVAEETNPAPTTLRPVTDNSTVPHSSSRYPLSAWTFAFENTTSSSSSVVPTYCEENWPSEQYRKVFGSVTTILQFVLPFFIISICYIWVSVKLNARARAKPGSKSSRREEADRDRKKRTNRMLIAMVAVFGLSWLPINVVNILDDFYEKSNEWRFYTLFFFVAHSIAMSSTCYNPFLYAWLNENFRKEFKHVLPCFNPSNNNIINITRTYNRSDRNTCGPRLHHNNDTEMDNGDNNLMLTEDKCAKKKDIIIPREATYGNGQAAMTGGGGKRDKKGVDILLNDDPLKEDNEVDSGDEQTVEMRFCETPFMSSDNTTGCSNFETSTTDNERTNVSLISN
ncbi:prolactin-releasing peptide receptor [Episyrphus balteatus]|uniref:prolactin-releasing peptide receptor n=1 Tax=Episyrphus balteatus TaxID=286459 RepID=UPI0024867AB8|nr:prolactin-releasing peptide receptor [Episyrphus balteatus]XP_055853679.1 prolactin-releasing peptide receptor [Episyrphus balteatus]XP_055853680.1 prolactin-releasing peptide receptor [Episyrphus balteatus]